MTEEPPKPIVMEMSPRTWTEYQDSINSTNQARGTTCKISLCSRTRLHVTLRRCQTTKQPTARQAKHSASSSVIACQTTKASRSTASHQLGVRPPKRTILILFSQVRLKQRLRPPHKSGSSITNRNSWYQHTQASPKKRTRITLHGCVEIGLLATHARCERTFTSPGPWPLVQNGDSLSAAYKSIQAACNGQKTRCGE